MVGELVAAKARAAAAAAARSGAALGAAGGTATSAPAAPLCATDEVAVEAGAGAEAAPLRARVAAAEAALAEQAAARQEELAEQAAGAERRVRFAGEREEKQRRWQLHEAALDQPRGVAAAAAALREADLREDLSAALASRRERRWMAHDARCDAAERAALDEREAEAATELWRQREYGEEPRAAGRGLPRADDIAARLRAADAPAAEMREEKWLADERADECAAETELAAARAQLAARGAGRGGGRGAARRPASGGAAVAAPAPAKRARTGGDGV